MNKNKRNQIYNRAILKNIDFQINNLMMNYKFMILLNIWIISEKKIKMNKKKLRRKRM